MIKKIRYLWTLLTPLFLLSCAATSPTVMQEPQPESSLLIGAVLLENSGIEDVYESKTSNIYVVIVGKSATDGKEKGYRIKTDGAGYFMIPNVPRGAYVLKGIEADLGYETRLKLTSRWEGNVQIYYPIETIIDQTVRVWPEDNLNKIINFNINHFSVDAAMRIGHNRYSNLGDQRLQLKNETYSMINPRDYFAGLYPASGWFATGDQ